MSPTQRSHFTRLRVALLIAVFFLFCFFVGCSNVEKKLKRPNLIAISNDQKKLLIYDTQPYRLLITDRNFKLEKEITNSDFYNVWGMFPTASDQIALTNNRDLNVTFSEEDRIANSVSEILFINFDGEIIQRKSWVAEKGPLKSPNQIIVLENGEFLVADSKDNRITWFNKSAECISTFGSFGHGPGELYYPNDICLDKNGNYVVVDSYNFRLAIFDSQGHFIKNVGEKGYEEGKLMFPQYVCTDDEGNLYCTELSTMLISVFDKNYCFKKVIDSIDWHLEEKLVSLFGIAFANDPWELYVLDSLNSKIYVLDKSGKLIKNISILN